MSRPQSLSEVVAAIGAGKLQELVLAKQGGVAPIATTWPRTWWLDPTGSPTTGHMPASGKANGEVVTRATAGAQTYNLPVSPAQMFLLAWGLISNSVTAMAHLADLITQVQVAHNETSGTIVGCDATSRLPASTGNGGGGQIACWAGTLLGAGTNVFTLGYTNEKGVAGRVIPQVTTIANAKVGQLAANVPGLFLPLQSGDLAVRSLDSITHVSGTDATGTLLLQVVRPFRPLPAMVTQGWQDRDFFNELPSLPRIYDESAFHLLGYNFSTASSGILTALVDILEN